MESPPRVATRWSLCFRSRYRIVLVLTGAMLVTILGLCIAMFVVRHDMRARCFGEQYAPDMYCIHERAMDRDVRVAAGWLMFFAIAPVWYVYAHRTLYRQMEAQIEMRAREDHRREWILDGVIEARLQNALYEMVANPGRSKYQHVFVDDRIVAENFDRAAQIARIHYVTLDHDEHGSIVADIL